MAIVYTELNFASTSGFELIDLTDKVRKFLTDDNLSNGVVEVLSPHTTMAVTINELEEGLNNDFHLTLAGLIPKGADYEHNALGENNADAHIKAMIIGQNVTVPIEEGKLALGTWQKIFAVELDGARDRKVNVIFIGEQV